MKAEDLPAFATDTRPEDLPALIGALAKAQAVAFVRLVENAQVRPADDSSEDRLLTMPEVAQRIGTTEHQAREMGRRGELPVVRVSPRRVRVQASALSEWIRLRENGVTLSGRRR